MIDVDIKKQETNETTWSGRLDHEQFQGALTDMVRKLVGLGPYENGLTLSVKVVGDPNVPELEFFLTQDHHYYRKHG